MGVLGSEALSVPRERRLDEARIVFNEMQKLLTRVIENEEIQLHIGRDLAEEINDALDRAATIAF